MSRARLIYTAAAKRDLDKIDEYLEQHAGRRIAARWIRELERRALSLAHHPKLGAVDEDLNGRRRLVVSPYLIVYRVVAQDEVHVVRIVDGRRDLVRLFSTEPDTGPEGI